MVRYKPLVPLTRPRELVVACTPMRSNVNLSAIARNSGCAGVEKVFPISLPSLPPLTPALALATHHPMSNCELNGM